MEKKMTFDFIVLDKSKQRVGYGFSTKRYLEKVFKIIDQKGHTMQVISCGYDFFKEQYCIVYD